MNSTWKRSGKTMAMATAVLAWMSGTKATGGVPGTQGYNIDKGTQVRMSKASPNGRQGTRGKYKPTGGKSRKKSNRVGW